MEAALKIGWRTVPVKGEQMFGRQPTFSTQTREQRSAMKRQRRRFIVAGERDVVFPAGTVRMRLRHNVMTEPVPLDLLLAA